MNVVFDIGGSHCRVGLADADSLHSIVKNTTDSGVKGYESFLELVREVVAGRQIDAVAGGMAGQFDTTGRFTGGRNLTEWRGWNAKEAIGQLVNAPVSIKNDVVMCGVGEAWMGAGAQRGVTSYMTVSTGVNAVRLLDGLPDPSIDTYELGYQLVSGGATHTSSLEELIGGASIENRRGLPPGEIPDPALWIQEARYVARAIHNMTLYWRPNRIVIGGTMMRDIHIEVIREALKTFATPLSSIPEIMPAELGDQAGLEGSRIIASHMTSM